MAIKRTFKNKYLPKVSIIIPVYNGEKYVKAAIKSALNQSYKNIEVIVINDGSTDNTEKILKTFGDKIKYFNKENGGVSSALNLGIKKMKGDYFSWLSHDDLYKKNKIKKQIEYIQSKDLNSVILYSDYQFINAKGRKIGKPIKHNSTRLNLYNELSILTGAINGISLLIPKEAFIKHGNFDELLYCIQDYKKWSELIKFYKFVHMDDVLVKTRLHDLQSTNRNPFVQLEGNNFWIKYIDSIKRERAIEIYGSQEIFYTEIINFLISHKYLKASKYFIQKKKTIGTRYEKK